MNGTTEPTKRRRVRTRGNRHGRQGRRERDRRRGEGSRFRHALSDGYKERDGRTVHVGRLPGALESKAQVREAFAEFGPVAHIHIHRDLKFGFVHFEEEASAAAALERRWVELLGSRLEVRSAVKVTDAASEDAASEAEPPPDGSEEEDGASEGAPSEGAEGAEGAEDGAEDGAAADPMLEFWSARGGEAGAAEEGDRDALEERVQALRAACVHTLDSGDGRMPLHELAQDAFVAEQRAALPGLSLLRVVRAFSENFAAEERGGGQCMVSLLSTDDSDTSRVEELVSELLSSKQGAKEPPRDRPADSGKETVVAGLLSDGWKDRDERTVWIGRLPDAVRSKQDVVDAFEKQFGRVGHVHIQRRMDFGFVHFDDERCAVAAIRAGFVNICGAKVEVRSGTAPGARGGRPKSQGPRSAYGAHEQQRAPARGLRRGAEDPPGSREPPAVRRRLGEASLERGWVRGSSPPRRELREPLPPPRPLPLPPPAPPPEARRTFHPRAAAAEPSRRSPAARRPPPRPSMAPHIAEQRGRPPAAAQAAATPARPGLPGARAQPAPAALPSSASDVAPQRRRPLPLPPGTPPRRAGYYEPRMGEGGLKRGRSPF